MPNSRGDLSFLARFFRGDLSDLRRKPASARRKKPREASQIEPFLGARFDANILSRDSFPRRRSHPIGAETWRVLGRDLCFSPLPHDVTGRLSWAGRRQTAAQAPR